MEWSVISWSEVEQSRRNIVGEQVQAEWRRSWSFVLISDFGLQVKPGEHRQVVLLRWPRWARLWRRGGARLCPWAVRLGNSGLHLFSLPGGYFLMIPTASDGGQLSSPSISWELCSKSIYRPPPLLANTSRAPSMVQALFQDCRSMSHLRAHSTCGGSRGVMVSSPGGRGGGVQDPWNSPGWRMTMGSSGDRDSSLPTRKEYPSTPP